MEPGFFMWQMRAAEWSIGCFFPNLHPDFYVKSVTQNETTMKKISYSVALWLICTGATTLFAQQQPTPYESMERLRVGNARFVNQAALHRNLTHERMVETDREGQHPYATILGCSDSRVPVESIFDVGIGEIFVIRVAGNVVDVDETGSIEYGVGHVHTPLLVVMGHSHCGAVTAVVNHAHVEGSIKPLVEHIQKPANEVMHEKGDAPAEELLEEAIRRNVWNSIQTLLANSGEIRHLVSEGKLLIVGAYYHLDSGQVEWMGELPGQAGLLENHSAPVH